MCGCCYVVEKAIALKWTQHFLFGWYPAKKTNKLPLTALLLVRKTKDTSFGQHVSTHRGLGFGPWSSNPLWVSLPTPTELLWDQQAHWDTLWHSSFPVGLWDSAPAISSSSLMLFLWRRCRAITSNRQMRIYPGRTEVRAVQEWSIVFLSCQPIWDRGFHTSDCFQLRAKAVHNNPLNGLSARMKGGQLLKLNMNLFASKENITSTSSVSCQTMHYRFLSLLPDQRSIPHAN